jgi:poly-D-alanine transfer protein DltD
MSGRIRYAFSQPWNAAVITSTEQEMLYTPQLSVKYLPTPTDTAAIDWTSLYAEAEAMHRSQCTNNPVFVIDDYYAEHVNGGHKHPDVLDEADDRELRDFRAFLDFLRVAHAKPLFILQPLNPYVYENLRELDPVMGTVRDAIRDHGFTCFDMWTSDTSTFRPGTLTDIMHLGPLGWYRVDSALQAYFHVDR